jgi:hypothetical protein
MSKAKEDRFSKRGTIGCDKDCLTKVAKKSSFSTLLEASPPCCHFPKLRRRDNRNFCNPRVTRIEAYLAPRTRRLNHISGRIWSQTSFFSISHACSSDWQPYGRLPLFSVHCLSQKSLLGKLRLLNSFDSSQTFISALLEVITA